MATENPRVATYLTKPNHEDLQDYCTRKGIKSLSAGIDRILTEFFGRLPEDPRSTPQTSSSMSADVVDRIAALERQMAELATVRTALGE
ncbi:MAG: hypothetical protein U7123_08580 [Potamolinea sp.]